MLISTFNLCKNEWLDLVFAKRNKDYGAYYLRQHNNANINKAMAITFITVIGLFILGSKLVKAKPVEVYHRVDIPLTAVINKKVEPPKKAEVHHAKAAAPKQTSVLVRRPAAR